MLDDASPGQTPDVDHITERLRGLLGRESISDDYVRLRIDVLRAQAAVLAELEGSAVLPRSAGSTQNGLPLAPELVPFDAALAQGLFDAVARACRQYGHRGPALTELQSAVAGEPSFLEQLIRGAAFAPDEEHVGSLSGRLGVSAELLVFASRLLAAPFVTSAARQRSRHAEASSPSSGTCPVCGSPPGLASLRPDDGARLLHCSLCANPWRFTRLDCPFCAAEDQPSLVRLTVAGEHARWIEACDRCKHYLKVVDRRQQTDKTAQDFLPLVEDVAGLYLDLVAEEEGYRRSPLYAALG
jgi:FdhE protein